MRMNASFILGGQQPDIVNTLARADAARAAKQNQEYQVDYRNALQTHGAGAAQGNQGAMNALAGYDPQMVQGLQTGRLNQQATRQRMAVLSAQEARAVEAHAASLSAAERQAQAQRIEQGVAMGLAAQTPEQWDQVVGQMAPELVGQFENREMLANRYRSIADIMKGMEPEGPQSTLGKIQADIDNGFVPEGTPLRANQPSETIYDTNGNVIIQRGEAPPKLTVEAGKNTGFYIRMKDSNQTLNSLEAEGLNFTQQNLDAVPLGIGNYFRTPEFQRFDQARRDFVNALLRRESGAVISDQEFANAEQQYFPVPGDSPEVIAQKQRNRENAIEGIRISSGEGAGFADRNATPQASEATAGGQENPFIGISDEEFRDLDLQTLTPEQIDLLFEARQP